MNTPREIKPTREWLDDLKEPVKSEALANFTNLCPEQLDLPHKGLYYSLRVGFDFTKTPQGEAYWENIIQHLEHFTDWNLINSRKDG